MDNANGIKIFVNRNQHPTWPLTVVVRALDFGKWKTVRQADCADTPSARQETIGWARDVAAGWLDSHGADPRLANDVEVKEA